MKDDKTVADELIDGLRGFADALEKGDLSGYKITRVAKPGGHDDAKLNSTLFHIWNSGPPIGSVWRHRKGGVYEVVTCAVSEADLTAVVVYREKSTGGVHHDVPLTWVRPLDEFNDGRFTLANWSTSGEMR